MPDRRAALVWAVVLVATAGALAGAPASAVGDAPGSADGPVGGTAELQDTRTGPAVQDAPPPHPTAAEQDPNATEPNATVTPQGANGTLSVHFLNVGQGASTLVVTPAGETMLIDSGDWRDDGEHVVAYLESLGVDRVDHLVTTHADADHVGGHAAVIEHFETEADGVGAVYDPGVTSGSATYARYLDAVEEHGVPLFETREGDRLPLAGANVTVLGPPDPYLANGDRNENSVVLLVRHGGTGFLFTGDAEAEGERHLVETYGDRLDVDVLGAGHHGSRSSTGEGLLDAATPGVVVVSSAYDSQFGHPHAETLDRLDDRAIPTYWTATHGTVLVRSNGSTAEVWTQQSAPTAAATLREGSPVEPGRDGPLERRTTVGAVVADGGEADGVDTPATSEPEAATSPPDADGAALSLVEVHADAAGNDNDNLNDEYLVFENRGEDALDLSGWRVADEAGATYTVPEGVTLAPGERVTLRSGSGTDDGSDLHWGSGSAVWNNGGDTVTVTDSGGKVVLEESYS